MLTLTEGKRRQEEKTVFLGELEIGATFYAKLFRGGEESVYLYGKDLLIDLLRPDCGCTVDYPDCFAVYEYRPVDIVGEIREVK